MKLALIVFIGFCVISAQAYPSYNENARSLIPQSIYDFVSGLMTAVKGLNNKVNEIITSIKDVIKSIIYQGIQKGSDAWAKVDAKLEEIKSRGDKPRACVEKYSPALKEAKSKMDSDIKQCSDSLVKEGEKVKSLLENGVQTLKDTINQFYTIIDECASFNPIKSAKCIHDHMGQFKDFIMNAIHDTEQAITDIRRNITEAAKNAAICTTDAVLDFGLKQKEITFLIQDCMQEKSTTSEPKFSTTEKLTEEPTARTTEEQTERTTEEQTVRTTEAPTARTTEEPTARTTEEPTERTTVEQTVRTTEEPTARTTEEPTARTTEEPTARTTEEVTEKVTEEPTARTTDVDN